MLKVCNLHYNQGISQSQIAQQLGISRPTVAKLLQRALDVGMVTITVNDLSGRKYYRLEQELEEKFGLNEVFIVESDKEEKITKENIGRCAAKLLGRLIKNDSIVGVSLGYTLSEMTNHLESAFFPNAIFIPLVGGLGAIPQEIQGNSISERLAKNFDARNLPFYTPARIVNKSLRDELTSEKTIQEVFGLAKKMDIALVGIGGVNENSTLQQTGYLDRQTHEKLKDEGICGDICMQFFDIHGNTDRYKINEEILTIDLDILKDTEYSIGVCFGPYKTDSIIGAIAGKYINTLITDLDTAQALLEKA